MSTRTRSTGEKGIAILVTAMLLIPLMVFAAFGVDLASWYSRISYLQKAADAASLAGTVWMPNVGTATTHACASLRENGITGAPSCGTGAFEVTVERGSTATSLRVTVTDPRATRYFSQVLGSGNQRLTRSAEAEYNLPIPLGSPLNYFGGDASRIIPTTHEEQQTTVNWPTDYNSTFHLPMNVPCNIGTSATQGVGRWSNATTFDPSGFSGSTRCLFEVRQGAQSSTTSTAPPDYDRLTNVPTNVPCNAFATGTNGRWQTGPIWQAGQRFTSGTGNRQCTWRNYLTSSLPSSTYRSNAANINGSIRPCNVGYQDQNGRWPTTGTYSASNRFTGLHTVGNQFCQFFADVTTTTIDVPDPNPISSSRSPGFWAAVEGPQTRAYQGDAYSTRCYPNSSCNSDENDMYDAASPDRGKWYVVKIPAGLSGSVSLNVFDASYVAGNLLDGAGDRTLDGGGNFPTAFRVYRQTNTLDFSARTPVTAGAADTTDGSCNWSVNQESSFKDVWRNLCNISVSPGQTYLVNVQATGTSGAGVNGYALEAVAGNNHANLVQPALYAYANMTMQNNNFCTGTCVPPPATFYLAEVGPQYAGRTLVMELWDSGDVSGSASMFPMMPATTSTNPTNPNLPKPVIPVPRLLCSFTADAEPNDRISGVTGTEYLTAQPSDSSTQCGVTTSTGSGVARFNGEWLRIRIDIPSDYTCIADGRNPEIFGNSCWWGIRYTFGASANDVTTWQARIEGNPVHLTQ